MGYVSYCCTKHNPRVPDSDFCVACGEHASFFDDDCDYCDGTGEVEHETDNGKLDWDYCPKCSVGV